MNDQDLLLRIKELKNFIKKVKPMYYYVRGWEDFRHHLLETMHELEYRAKFMDDKMVKFRQNNQQ
jgi:hypothetical protein